MRAQSTKNRSVDAEFYRALIRAKVRYERLCGAIRRLGQRDLLPREFVSALLRGEDDADHLALTICGVPAESSDGAFTRRSPTRRLAASRHQGWGLLVRDGLPQAPEELQAKRPEEGSEKEGGSPC